ncbi:MAG: Sec-independent protein translocase protein TatB [Pseudomonadota bacterium]
MFDIGWTEFMVIGVVALVVIGPKDLPEMFRTMGRFTAKARSMARDFQRAMDTAANEAGVKDVAKDLKNITSARSMGLDAVKDAAAKFEKWDPLKPAIVKPAASAPVAIPDPAAPAPTPAPAPAPVMGPATQALADQVAAKKAIAAEAVEKMKAVSAAPVEVTPSAAPAVIRAPRLRKSKPEAPAAPTPVAKAKPKFADAPEPAPKPTPKPRAKKADAKTATKDSA